MQSFSYIKNVGIWMKMNNLKYFFVGQTGLQLLFVSQHGLEWFTRCSCSCRWQTENWSLRWDSLIDQDMPSKKLCLFVYQYLAFSCCWVQSQVAHFIPHCLQMIPSSTAAFTCFLNDNKSFSSCLFLLLHKRRLWLTTKHLLLCLSLHLIF